MRRRKWNEETDAFKHATLSPEGKFQALDVDEKKVELPCSIDAGTLLGAVRSQQIFCWEYDAPHASTLLAVLTAGPGKRRRPMSKCKTGPTLCAVSTMEHDDTRLCSLFRCDDRMRRRGCHSCLAEMIAGFHLPLAESRPFHDALFQKAVNASSGTRTTT